jgi:plastocyanin
MAGYYVLGVALVLAALVLTAVGLRNEGFPPTKGVARMVMAVAGALALSTFAAVVGTTKREHPREEAASKRAEAKGRATAAEGTPRGPVRVVETEYLVRLPGGPTVNAGKLTLDVANEGKIEHDLAVERGSTEQKKTALIAPGKGARLRVALKSGKYKLYCTVPGHRKLGMKTEITVR